MIRQRGMVYDVGRSMGSLSMNWRPDYTEPLMRRELDVIRDGLHANAVRLGGRDLRRLLTAADYAASIGLDVWLGPELWNATPRRTLAYVTEAAAAAEPLCRRWPGRLTFSVGNELTLFMRGIVPGRTLAQRSRLPRLRPVVLSGQDTLRAFLAQAAAAAPLSLLGMQVPAVRRLIRPRVRTVHPRDEQAQARLLIDQLELLGQAGVDRAFVMSFSFPLAPYSEDPGHDLDATALSIVRTLPRGQHGTTYPGVGWEPKEAFHAVARYYHQQAGG